MGSSGKQPDYTAPVVLRSGQNTVEDFVSLLFPLLARAASNRVSVARSTKALSTVSRVRSCMGAA